MADKNVGKIIQVISAVLDIKFSEGNLPGDKRCSRGAAEKRRKAGR